MKSRTETALRCQDSFLLPLVWRALESGIGSGRLLKANGPCPTDAFLGIDGAFPGIDRQHTPRGRPS
jgi:hypothetical protein